MTKTGYFEEKPGVKSSTRVNSFILLMFLMVFDLLLILVIGCVLNYYFVLFNLIMLVAISTPKYLHKIAEMKFGRVGSSDEDAPNQKDRLEKYEDIGHRIVRRDEDIDINAPA